MKYFDFHNCFISISFHHLSRIPDRISDTPIIHDVFLDSNPFTDSRTKPHSSFFYRGGLILYWIFWHAENGWKMKEVLHRNPQKHFYACHMYSTLHIKVATCQFLSASIKMYCLSLSYYRKICDTLIRRCHRVRNFWSVFNFWLR